MIGHLPPSLTFGVFVAVSLLVAEVARPWEGEVEPGASPQSLTRSATDDDLQDLLYFGESRPVIIRLRIRIGDETFRETWRHYETQLFKDLDQNGETAIAMVMSRAASFWEHGNSSRSSIRTATD